MAAEGIVQIVGLDELVKAFRKIDKDINADLRTEFVQLADTIVERAQQKMPFVSGTALRSVRPVAQAKFAGISYPRGGPSSKGSKDGYYPWLDFGGGKAGARGITSSSPTAHAKSTGGFKRPHIKGGRYIYPAIAESSDEIRERALAAVERAAERAEVHVDG